MTGFENLARGLLDLVYPPHCLACKRPLEKREGPDLCGRCIVDIKPNPMPWCPRCGRPVESAGRTCPECKTGDFYFERNYSVCLYDGVIKECIHQFKYKGKLRFAPFLSQLMIDFIRAHREIIEGADAVAAVPLSRKKLREREYNQSEILARRISGEFSMPYLDALEKTRSTRPQNELNKDERKENLRGAFAVKEAVSLNGKNILVVDDVFTTGSTVNESSRALVEAGAGKVYSLTLARGA